MFDYPKSVLFIRISLFTKPYKMYFVREAMTNCRLFMIFFEQKIIFGVNMTNFFVFLRRRIKDMIK
jgi:hypothetical protein